MRYLLTAALLLTAATAHAGLIEFHGGEFTSSIAANFAPAVTETSPLGQNHRGPQYSTTGYLGRASASVGITDQSDYAAMSLRGNMAGDFKLWAGEAIYNDGISVSGYFDFTTNRELKLYWRDTLPGFQMMTLNGVAPEFVGRPLTEWQEYYAVLPAGRHRVDFAGSTFRYGTIDAISKLILTIPEPSSVLLLAGCVVLAVVAKRYPLVLRTSDERAGAV